LLILKWASVKRRKSYAKRKNEKIIKEKGKRAVIFGSRGKNFREMGGTPT
jgi:hypothetical protein